MTDEIVWELMLQVGRIANVHLPKDRVTQTHQGYGFVEFHSEEDAEYAAKVMNQIRLWGKAIRVNKASADKQKTLDVGAELFVGNLDPMLDERVLYDTFSRFGPLTQAPKISRDENNLSKGFGFVSFTNFESSDMAIQHMHGQYLMNKEVTVQYAYKKDGKGERHGDAAERALAASGRAQGVEPAVQALPPQLFQTQQQSAPPGMMNGMGAPGAYNAVPPPQQQQRQQLQAPPGSAGLPPRPMSSAQGFAPGMPPGFAPGMPPPFAPPPGFAAPPGFAPPPGMQNGYGAPPGMPPMMPPGFQQRR